ncbi:acyl-phosphate glycerol 3-phosphate acyltransferase [Floricoccus tropicus]|uniref:Acyl-phosphate glycerol 3-phosphate acyltransferase n=1 Tax=Floricoccus tropicus TaxID=1859473 RepID=A0A1E8GL77_9LACT|nr:1-acyl-sn-glycerol-3-phosphate acyltransferase [Floricoccus tropicus]OFI48927.1 acyl-phosphate glycerol 3-phosphate acyltransferase [Floricoccus tropicus]
MFYAFLRNLVAFLLYAVNGRPEVHNLDKLPDKEENYILVAPHRTLWDPVYLAFLARPKQFIFMAKKELFKNKIFAWWIKKCGAFPVDRENPGPSALKIPIKELKEGNKSLIMFPSGTRHSDELKGGVVAIAKLSKARIIPAVYQGPLTFKDLFKRKKVKMNFGDPIDMSDIKRANAEGIDIVTKRIDEAFKSLDYDLDPNYKYIPVKK